MAAPKVVSPFASVSCKDYHHQYQATTGTPTRPLTTSSGGDRSLFSRPPPFFFQEGREDEDSESWQELAFDQDYRSVSAGICPPRFYACSFCRRKFRSAQALGGHMNVHRRDRFRLRQSPFLLGGTIPYCTNSINSPLAATITPSTALCLLYPGTPKVSPSSTFLAALHTPSRNDLFLTSSARSTSPLPAASKTKDKTRCNPNIDSNIHKNKMQKRASETYQPYSPQTITENSDIHSQESSRFCTLDLELRLGQSNCRKPPC